MFRHKSSGNIRSHSVNIANQRISLTRSSIAALKNYNITDKINKNYRDLKALKFDITHTLADGETLKVIPRDQPVVIDIVEGTYMYYKIQPKDLLSPIKITI